MHLVNKLFSLESFLTGYDSFVGICLILIYIFFFCTIFLLNFRVQLITPLTLHMVFQHQIKQITIAPIISPPFFLFQALIL